MRYRVTAELLSQCARSCQDKPEDHKQQLQTSPTDQLLLGILVNLWLVLPI